MKNNSLEDIGKIILESDNILIYPHINMDGDAMGSASALCRALLDLGKNAEVVIEEKIPDNLKFLDRGYCVLADGAIKNPDLSICIDCGDRSRIGSRNNKFDEAEINICIDHHRTTNPFCKFNYIDPQAAATGQLIYKLLAAMKMKISKEIGESIFAAITTDTGNFQYSNTSKETHEIVAALYDAGIDSNYVSVRLYENLRLQKLILKGKVLDTLNIFDDGKCAIAYVTQNMLSQTETTMDETDGIVETVRSISGVEIACLLKESAQNKTKVSLRAKTVGNVAEIASAFGGGGHEKAAGFTLVCNVSEAFERVKEQMIKNLDKYDKRSNL